MEDDDDVVIVLNSGDRANGAAMDEDERGVARRVVVCVEKERIAFNDDDGRCVDRAMLATFLCRCIESCMVRMVNDAE